MSVNPNFFVRKLVSLPHALVEEIQEYRFRNRFNAVSETIRHLIERGLKRSEASQDTMPERNIELPAISGPFPWQKVSTENATKAMNVLLPARLKMQMDWLVNESELAGKPVTLRAMVIDVLTIHVERALRARAIDPG
jgi:Arc/MetJ-type ribon-helix-helix transcriptional regulator